jgi:hypothetical protein
MVARMAEAGQRCDEPLHEEDRRTSLAFSVTNNVTIVSQPCRLF